MKITLFSRDFLSDKFEGIFNQVNRSINALQDKDVNNSSLEELVEKEYNQFSLHPLCIYKNDIEIGKPEDYHESNQHIIKISYTIPYSGDRDLWSYKTSGILINQTKVELLGSANPSYTGVLVITEYYLFSEISDNQINNDINAYLEILSKNITLLHKEVSEFNNKLRDFIKKEISRRISELSRLSQITKNLKYPNKE